MPTDNAGNSLALARNLGILTTVTQNFSDFVGVADTNDFYKFTLDGTRNLRLSLSGLSADADVKVLASDGATVLGGGVNSGIASEAINLDGLTAGTYYVRVYPGTTTSSTNYSLGLSAQVPPTPVISISSTSANTVKSEGNSGNTAFTFTVARTGNTAVASTVAYAVTGVADATRSATAASASDFASGVLPGGTLSFAAGETSKTLTLNVAGDTAIENNERFNVTLSAPTNATLGTSLDYGIINNDDVAGQPEVVVLGNNLDIVDGDTTPGTTDATDFGSASQNATAPTRTFTVRNTGTAALNTSGLVATGGFTITEGLTTSIAAGASDTFTVRMDTRTAGTIDKAR